MLYEFLTSHRQELIKRCKENVSKRFEPAEISTALDHGVPLFLQQLTETLHEEQTTSFRPPVGSASTPTTTQIGRSAAIHGAELLRLGYSVGQVVHDYGDVCQSITALALERKFTVTTEEFRTLNRCLDDAIADAVASFGKAGQVSSAAAAATLQERLSVFANEQRRLVEIVSQAFTAIKTGNIGLGGATGTLLTHALAELGSLAERTLPEIRLARPRRNDLPH